MERENRFLVLKRDDINAALHPAQKSQLQDIIETVRKYRQNNGKTIHHYVCVADDWPEFEKVWGMIEALVDAQQGLPLESGEVTK